MLKISTNKQGWCGWCGGEIFNWPRSIDASAIEVELRETAKDYGRSAAVVTADGDLWGGGYSPPLVHRLERAIPRAELAKEVIVREEESFFPIRIECDRTVWRWIGLALAEMHILDFRPSFLLTPLTDVAWKIYQHLPQPLACPITQEFTGRMSQESPGEKPACSVSHLCRLLEAKYGPIRLIQPSSA
jgi:hypothetical protein